MAVLRPTTRRKLPTCGHLSRSHLNGAKPSELSVELSTRPELIVNLKIAKVLGLTIPETLLSLADEVIE